MLHVILIKFRMKVLSFTTNMGEEVPLGDLTVLVGPNNTGKSQTLDDIHTAVKNKDPSGMTIIDEVNLDFPTEFEQIITGVSHEVTDSGRDILYGTGSDLQSSERQGNVSFDNLRSDFESERYPRLRNLIGKFRVSYLDTSSRLSVANSSEMTNLHKNPPTNLLQSLYTSGKESETKLRLAFQETFEKDIKIDYSGGQLALRVGKEVGEFDDVPEDPRDLYDFMEEYDMLDEEGDGFRSFVGVILSLLLSEKRIVLLDEPDAFLHPAQSRELGSWIAEHGTEVPTQLVVATHDANFISGLLSGPHEIDIFRLNRTGNYTAFNRLTSEITEQLFSDPLLSSQRVLDSIFHEGVIVCEGDSDRSVYQATATRKLDSPDLLFVHAHNKQKIKEITHILTEASIPVAAITDIDILRDHHDLRYLLESLTTEDISDLLDIRRELDNEISERDDEEIIRGMIEDVDEFADQLKDGDHDVEGARTALGRLRSGFSEWSEIKENGVEAFPDDYRDDAESLIDELEEIGLFIVRVGELEGWMDLGTSRKSTWVVKALEEIYSGDCDEALVDFISRIDQYLDDEYEHLVKAVE